MANDNKTQPTDQDILEFIASLPARQQPDAEVLVEMMQDVSGHKPVLWGRKL